MSSPLAFSDVARIPAPGDNAAIATRRLEAGTTLLGNPSAASQPQAPSFVLSHTVLEGHRFALRTVAAGEPLLSWGLPFGLATTTILPGHYLANPAILAALKIRHVDFPLPEKPNFVDHGVDYHLDEERFHAGQQVPLSSSPATFLGFPRSGQRGTGTRNYIAILGTTSLSGGYARALAERCQRVPTPNIDGVVAIAHTEGGGTTRPNNLELVLRTLAGFMVHPNIGAVLAVDWGTEPVTNALLAEYMREHHYPLEGVPHHFLSLRGSNYQDALAQGERVIQSWLPQVSTERRRSMPLSGIKIGLQCGGSDAFSGVSGNPLAGWLAKELIRHGGSANLAETPELVGAEPYVLQNVRTLEVARAFLSKLQRFEEWAGWHGHSAAGNPSGGNLYRGLYNISIKAIGAARKKDPDLRLDHVIDFGVPMDLPGFYFMDSPGNDLESIAGQVASGCNLILFVTGNGSITNFPFVPTIKIVTTTGRYELLRNEMDINGGRYLDGVPLDVLGAEAFGQMLEVVSGRQSVGEKAGHYQVQLWREWRQTNSANLAQLRTRRRPDGQPWLTSALPSSRPAILPSYRAFKTSRGVSSDQIGLIVPTSLCSSQIARLIVDRLNQSRLPGLTRCVALPHTEGCGVSSGESEQLYMRTMTGYLCHPFVRRALLLEHGCEKTHNDEMHSFLREQQVDDSHFGWASVQLDGGIDAVSAKVVQWFVKSLQNQPALTTETVEVGHLRVGLTADGEIPSATAHALAQVAGTIINAGGTVVIPRASTLLADENFASRLGGGISERSTISYGEPALVAGLHVMETPTDHQGEILTGLGATGVEIMVAHISNHPLSAHPMIPLLQIGALAEAQDLDLILAAPDPVTLSRQILDLILRTAGRDYSPKLFLQGNTDFQITRGLVGVSL